MITKKVRAGKLPSGRHRVANHVGQITRGSRGYVVLHLRSRDRRPVASVEILLATLQRSYSATRAAVVKTSGITLNDERFAGPRKASEWPKLVAQLITRMEGRARD